MNTKTINTGMKPSHPGDFIRTEILDELGLTVSKAAEVLQVRRATLSDLVNGKAGVSPEMALRIRKGRKGERRKGDASLLGKGTLPF
jgi:antitoxin HigA-1